jgi:hypothetical protein
MTGPLIVCPANGRDAGAWGATMLKPIHESKKRETYEHCRTIARLLQVTDPAEVGALFRVDPKTVTR